MSKMFKRGDHVEWNSEARRVLVMIIREIISDVHFKSDSHRCWAIDLSCVRK